VTAAIELAVSADAALTVAVTALCEFAAKRGDLDLRFAPGPSALEGIEGHGTVARRRGSGWQREVRLEGLCEGLRVVGRADGFDAAACRLEEIKTHRGNADRIAPNQRELHWAQAMCYGALLCERDDLPAVDIAVVYFEIATRAETAQVRTFARAALRDALSDLCRRYRDWALRERAHRAVRDDALRAMVFPQATFRTGQRQLAEHAWHAARSHRCLLAQAPTGIGKTLGTLFPTLKAMPDAGHFDRRRTGLDKVIFLTAKNSGRTPAVATLAALREGGLPLRVVELVARDKACVHPDKACHGESCPLARGFYDRLAAARDDAVRELTASPLSSMGAPAVRPELVEGHAPSRAEEPFDRLRANGPVSPAAVVAAVAARHAVCPYYLNQELVRWADVVVADYNHWFDRGGWLHAMTVEHGWAVALLVDEAHNLVERARDMYSATLRWRDWARARRSAPAALKRPLNRIARAWRDVQPPAGGYALVECVPDGLVQAISRSLGEWVEAWACEPMATDPLLLECFGQALAFESLAASFGEHALAEVCDEPDAPNAPNANNARSRPTIAIRNVVPAPYIGARLATARSAVLFSATLQPPAYYRDMLGLPADTAVLEVDSPFRAEQLEVRIAANLSTRWRDRDASIAPIVRLIGQHHAARPGNYLAFFGSYAYMQAAAQAFAEFHPEIPAWSQRPGMGEAERDDFLARFAIPDEASRGGVGFAVLGGAFAEGIDLPGERLVGAFIATLGMPQASPSNEAMRERLDRLFGDGHAYVYFYPGMRRVVQAAGRVIRTPQDRGLVMLLDDRFAQARARRVLPGWWRPALFRLG
jgi:DNA excision repair protein ERCC-2